PLHLAAFSGDLGTVQFLYNNGANIDINKTDVTRSTPLHLAAFSSDLGTVQFLYNNGANIDINKTDSRGHTPLHLAALRGNLETVKFLYDNSSNIDINKTDAIGRTPLYLAVLGGNLETVKFLYNNGANINGSEKAGYTPLDRIFYNVRGIEISQFLIEHGANATNQMAEEAATDNPEIMPHLLAAIWCQKALDNPPEYITFDNSEQDNRIKPLVPTVLKGQLIANGTTLEKLDEIVENAKGSTNETIKSILTEDFVKDVRNTIIENTAKDVYLGMLEGKNPDENTNFTKILEDPKKQEVFVKKLSDVSKKHGSENAYENMINLANAIQNPNEPQKTVKSYENKDHSDLNNRRQERIRFDLAGKINGLANKIKENRESIAQDLQTLVDNKRVIDIGDVIPEFDSTKDKVQAGFLVQLKKATKRTNESGRNSYDIEIAKTERNPDEYLLSPNLTGKILERMNRLADSQGPYREQNDDIRLLEFLNGSILDESGTQGLLNNLDKHHLPKQFKEKMIELKSMIDDPISKSPGVQRVKSAIFEERNQLEGDKKAKIIQKAFRQHRHYQDSKEEIIKAQNLLERLKRNSKHLQAASDSHVPIGITKNEHMGK
ncbi:MAG: ankyrin repeat domain-containing protein, partial [Rickettsiaceae bacterium]|nr:ankyrin repeat domain-containing protein [Rickettsiaceae bacterium]